MTGMKPFKTLMSRVEALSIIEGNITRIVDSVWIAEEEDFISNGYIFAYHFLWGSEEIKRNPSSLNILFYDWFSNINSCYVKIWVGMDFYIR